MVAARNGAWLVEIGKEMKKSNDIVHPGQQKGWLEFGAGRAESNSWSLLGRWQPLGSVGKASHEDQVCIGGGTAVQQPASSQLIWWRLPVGPREVTRGERVGEKYTLEEGVSASLGVGSHIEECHCHCY